MNPADPGAIDLEALKASMTPVKNFVWTHWFNQCLSLIAAVEALRKQVASLTEMNRRERELVDTFKGPAADAAHYLTRAEAAEAELEARPADPGAIDLTEIAILRSTSGLSPTDIDKLIATVKALRANAEAWEKQHAQDK